ncbi:hypothetical protein AB0B45_38225 [Nonomuraea sp. NPDC049152]|uniref:hypothetical protein n=1 Tax=Nonomuraea sp. NPDC049152 TaxID=3154350 RepID=UPI0033F0464E
MVRAGPPFRALSTRISACNRARSSTNSSTLVAFPAARCSTAATSRLCGRQLVLGLSRAACDCSRRAVALAETPAPPWSAPARRSPRGSPHVRVRLVACQNTEILES